jgi:hypothetical protein
MPKVVTKTTAFSRINHSKNQKKIEIIGKSIHRSCETYQIEIRKSDPQ